MKLNGARNGRVDDHVRTSAEQAAAAVATRQNHRRAVIRRGDGTIGARPGAEVGVRQAPFIHAVVAAEIGLGCMSEEAKKSYNAEASRCGRPPDGADGNSGPAVPWSSTHETIDACPLVEL